VFDRQGNNFGSDQCRFGKPAGKIRYAQTITDMGMFGRNWDVGGCRSIKIGRQTFDLQQGPLISASNFKTGICCIKIDICQ